MANQVRVVTEPAAPPTGHLIYSPPAVRSWYTLPPYLEYGITQTYEVFAGAIDFARRLADAFVRTLPHSALQERVADAHGWFALAEEERADAKVWLVNVASSVSADAKIPFGTQEDKAADAHGWFTGNIGEALVDAFGALGELVERSADALVYFGTLSEAYPDARSVYLHISDVKAIQQFISNHIPEMWETKWWGVTVVPLRLGEAKKVMLPKEDLTKGVLYLAREEWWLVDLPSDSDEVVVYNQSHPKLVAFVFFYKTE